MSLQDGHHHNHHNTPSIKSNPDVPIDPSIAQSSPTYPGPYSPYAPQGHEMAQYPGHPPQGYGHWPGQGYGHPHGMPGGPYSSPGSGVSPGGAQATAGPPRPGQVSPLVLSGVIPLISAHRVLTRSPRFTRSFLFLVHNSTSAPAAATKRLSACTNVGTKGARKLMGLLII